jgi:anthranilate synthase component 2
VPRILVFDNYDSFTYNLVHLVEKLLHQKVEVYRNDQIPLEKVKEFDKIILSPGPGIPIEAGLLLPLIKEYASSKSILGVCLGHQAIGEAFGGKLVNLSTVYHGVSTPVKILQRASDDQRTKGAPDAKGGQGQKETLPGKDLFEGMPDGFEAGRYHSWVLSDEGFPQELEVTARDENDYIMALRHKNLDVQGVQFHPESVLTPLGERILKNWLSE